MMKVIFLKLFLIILFISNAMFIYGEDNSSSKDYSSTSSSDEIKYEGERFLRGEFFEDSEDYVLGKGDAVKVLVRGKPEFSGNYEIGPDGQIQFPFLDDIKAEGLKKTELKEKITTQLETYVKFPEISVSIIKYRSKHVYILGEVNNPGKYFMTGDSIALRDAIIQAGLPTPHAALKRTKIIKTDDLKPTYKNVNLKNILYKGKLKDNIMLVSGDLVVVPSTVHSTINRFIAKLLDPITRVAVVDDLVQRHE